MSRSRKKAPVFKDTDRYAKRLANHAVRHSKAEFSMKGNAYKRCFPSWNICECTGRWTLEDALKTYHDPVEGKRFRKYWKTEEDFVNYWKKEVLWK